MNEMKLNRGVFISSVLLLLALMIISGILTKFIPSGHFERMIVDGVEQIIPGTFQYLDSSKSLSIIQWFTAPFNLLVTKDGLVVLVVSSFILMVGGTFAIFNKTGILEDLIETLIQRFSGHPQLLVFILSFFFMFIGAVFGILEEVIPLIPIMILVARRLGYDVFTGLGMSLLAVGFGFSACLFNPFTIGVAQKIAGVPIFSGLWYRTIIFIVTYIVLIIFLKKHMNQIENPEIASTNLQVTKTTNKAGFGTLAIGTTFLFIIMLSLPFLNLSDLSMPLIGLGFTITGLAVGLARRLTVKETLRLFGKGALDLAPSILLILLAMSVKYIIESAAVLDTILYYVSEKLMNISAIYSGIGMYIFVFLLQLFIPSATAKAFLVMPILAPLGELVGLTKQTVVLAFNFGDGFSHLLYPTNPMLLIALGMANVSFFKWLKWTWGIQLLLFIITMIFLIIAVLFNYGPV